MSHFFYLTPQILLPFSPLTSQEFDLIRRKAGASWQNETRWSNSSVTTYTGSYRKKQLDDYPCSRLSLKAGQHWPECNQVRLLVIDFQEVSCLSPLSPIMVCLPDRHTIYETGMLKEMEENAGPIPSPAIKWQFDSQFCAKNNPSGWASADNQAIFLQLQKPCNSTSKTSSSEDSEADQYSVYSLGGPSPSFC
nr:uncharacterized protein C4orf51 homolog [Camelus dromedarius]